MSADAAPGHIPAASVAVSEPGSSASKTASPRPIRERIVPAHGPWPTDVHPVVARVLAARGVLTPESADLRLRDMLDPGALSGLDAAVDLLQRALDDSWRMLVVGDFDCDGATASAVTLRGLRLLGARNVSFRVPHRMRHGYGLSAQLIAELATPLPQLIVTVDNGISSLEGVAAARAAGIRVLITDHHLQGAALPAADAIVNPNVDGDAFPSKHLAGVGVVFYLLLALRKRLREAGRFAGRDEPDLSSLLDLVALGTVADLVALDRNNRILVAAGLKRMRAGRAVAGIQALMEVSGRRAETMKAEDLGFAIGPRINAAGRLDDMSLGIECLLEDDPGRALDMARRLDAINQERRALQSDMTDEAMAGLEQDDALPRGQVGLCVFAPHWHAGVVGLVASKIKERWHRPAVAFAPADEDAESELLRGSARSIPGFHIRDALAEVQARQPGLIERFGGHAMAAGLTLRREHFETFAEAFDAVSRARLDGAALDPEWLTDGGLGGEVINRALAEQLELSGPFGQAFPTPLFCDDFEVLEWRVLKERHLKMLLATDCGSEVHAIEFNGWNGAAPEPRVRIVYQLQCDDYGRRRATQLLVRDRQPAR